MLRKHAGLLFAFFICAIMLSPLAEAEICPGCEGSGYCQECGGDGWVVIFPCGHCDGTGVCPTCDGAGEITTTAEIGICVGIVVIIIIILIAIIVYAVKKKETTVIREPPPYPQQYQQPPPPQIYPCSTCKQSLRYIDQNQRWYCDTCRKYV